MTENKPFRKEWTLEKLRNDIALMEGLEGLEGLEPLKGDIWDKAAETVALLRKELYLVGELDDDEIFIQKRWYIVKSLNYPNMLED